MTDLAKWPGTVEEFNEFQSVMLRLLDDCTCRAEEINKYNVKIAAITCDAHRAGLGDQRWLDGLVFMRRRRAWLMREEGTDLAS